MEYEKNVPEKDDLDIQETLSEPDYYSGRIFECTHEKVATSDYDDDYELFQDYHRGNNDFQFLTQ